MATLFEDRPDMRVLQLRSGEFKTREDGEELIIEGYFAVFDSNYEMWEGASESIAPGAFDNALSGDIRALTNHDTTLVLGRTVARTLELESDSHGLFGRVKINPKDLDAVNTYERVKRGDVSQCSIGFIPTLEETEFNDRGDVHWTIKEAELFEVSVCTFPAYEQTSINARKRDVETIRAKKLEAWKLSMRSRLEKKSNQEEKDDVKSIDASQED